MNNFNFPNNIGQTNKQNNTFNSKSTFELKPIANPFSKGEEIYKSKYNNMNFQPKKGNFIAQVGSFRTKSFYNKDKSRVETKTVIEFIVPENGQSIEANYYMNGFDFSKSADVDKLYKMQNFLMGVGSSNKLSFEVEINIFTNSGKESYSLESLKLV